MTNEGVKKSGDPLKYYCIVFGLLILVVGFVYFKLQGQLEDYKLANRKAGQYLTGKGLADVDGRGRPNKLSELALGVDRMVKGYAQSIGTSESGDSGISQKTMDAAQRSAQVTMFRSGRETIDENKAQGYVDISKEFVYEETTLKNLIALTFNVEELGRYRVTEIRWQLRDENKNSTAPFWFIQRPSIRVAFRKPLVSGADD